MSLDQIQMRDGSSFTGAVKNATFTIVVTGAGKVTVARDRVIEIVFRDPSTGPHDRVTLKDGTTMMGAVTDPSIDLASDNVGDLSLSTPDVLAVQFMFEEL
jgi:hypothetical protein